MARVFKSKVFWIIIIAVISLSVTGVTLGVLLSSHNETNINLSQSSGDSSTTYTYTDQYGDWTWYINTDNTTATIKEFTGTTANITIPTTIEKDGTTYTVTQLYSGTSSDNGVFHNVISTLKSAIIPSTITTIGRYAFYNCSMMNSVTIGSGVTTINGSTFYGCYKLLEIINKSSLIVKVGSDRVQGNSVNDWLGTYAKIVITNESQTKYQVIDNVKYYIDNSKDEYIAVDVENDPTSITINNSCTSIYKYAFTGCTSLTSVVIGDNVENVSDYSFKQCTNLTSVMFGGSVTNIGHFAFHECSKLTGVTLPSTLTTIGQDAFCNCVGLLSITIPDSVTKINAYAFDGCTGLTNITIGSGVTNIGDLAFWNCNGLTRVDYTGTIGQWCNISFFASISNPLTYAHNFYIGDQLITDLVIPNTVTEIKQYAFNNCTCLTSLEMSNGVTSIGGSVFAGCTGLTSVEMSNSVTSIGGSAFAGCTGLTRVDYTGTIGQWCNINFSDGNSNPLTCAHNLYIDDKLVTEIFIPNTVTEIKSYAFYNCTSLKRLAMADTITSIGQSAFSNCTGLVNAVIGSGVTRIFTNSFKNCSNLIRVFFTHDYTAGVQTGDNTSDNFIGLNAFTLGNSDVTYYFLNQESRDNAYNVIYEEATGIYYIVIKKHNRSVIFTGDNFELIETQFNVEVNNINLGSVIGNTNPSIGESTTLTAVPNTDCTFCYWLKDGEQFEGSTNPVLTTTFTEYIVTYTAVFFGYFTVTTNVSNNEYGTVTGGGTYACDTEITLTATPNGDYVFIKWLKNNEDFDGNSSNTLNITVEEDVTYTAVIEVAYIITTEANDATYGSVTSGGIYLQNTSYTITATANRGYTFTKWLKNGQDFTNNILSTQNFIATEDATYTAVFEAIPQRTITVENLTPNVGSVTSGGIYYDYEVLTLTATPNNGAKFFYWLKNGQVFSGSLSNPLTVTIIGDATYTVCFAPENFRLEIPSPNSVILEYEYQGEDEIDPAVCGRLTTFCYGDFDNKSTVRIEATPTTGYRFVGWKINGETTISEDYTSNKVDILLSDIQNSRIVIAVFGKAT